VYLGAVSHDWRSGEDVKEDTRNVALPCSLLKTETCGPDLWRNGESLSEIFPMYGFFPTMEHTMRSEWRNRWPSVQLAACVNKKACGQHHNKLIVRSTGNVLIQFFPYLAFATCFYVNGYVLMSCASEKKKAVVASGD